MMNSHAKKKTRRLVLRREQVRQLDAGHLAQLRGGIGYSAGACTESCASCHQTTDTHDAT